MPNIEVIAAGVRDISRIRADVAKKLDAITERYGDLETLLQALEWDGADTAYLLHIRKDGAAETVKHNVMPGQLVTALERGFLPVTLARYNASNGTTVPQLEARRDVRSDTGERPPQPESSRLTDEDLYCEPCDRVFATLGGLGRHFKSNSHINRIAELDVA